MGKSSAIVYKHTAFPKIWKHPPPKKCSVEEEGCNHMEQVPLTLLTAWPEVEMPVNNRNLHPTHLHHCHHHWLSLHKCRNILMHVEKEKDWQQCRIGVSNNLLQRQSVIFPTNLFLSFQFSTQPLSVIGPCLLVLIFVCWSEVLRLHKKSISISIRTPQKVARLANVKEQQADEDSWDFAKFINPCNCPLQPATILWLICSPE